MLRNHHHHASPKLFSSSITQTLSPWNNNAPFFPPQAPVTIILLLASMNLTTLSTPYKQHDKVLFDIKVLIPQYLCQHLCLFCFESMAAIPKVWGVRTGVCCGRVPSWERHNLCFYMCLTAFWRMAVRDKRSCCNRNHCSHNCGEDGSGFRVEQWGWREVERSESDVHGGIRKKMEKFISGNLTRTLTQGPVSRWKFQVNSLPWTFPDSWAEHLLESKLCIHQCLIVNEGTCFLGRARHAPYSRECPFPKWNKVKDQLSVLQNIHGSWF